MRSQRAALAATLVTVLGACSQPAPKTGPQTPTPAPTGQAPADAPSPSDEEKLAAIQKAMNELDEAAQGCWAMAATERFDIEGELTVLVDISPTTAKTQVTQDTARNAKLVSCVAELLAQYKWAPPLYGQSIQLPFKFKAPDGQSVIDRRLVETKTQDKVSVAVLLDESNTGNAGASMFEVGIAANAATGWRKTERAELWYFLTPATVNTGSVGFGDMLFVKAGGVRTIGAKSGDMHAVLVVVPGGKEGTARAGALPTQAVSDKQQTVVHPLLAKDAKTFGPATIFLDDSIEKGTPLAASILRLPRGISVPEHVHGSETEMLYILEGSGTMTVAGQDVAVTPTSVIQIPPNTKHAFTATADVRALQIYTPAGPEQRFKKRP